jgi:hypothetical protein
MLQLDLVVMQQSLEESMGRGCESVLMEGHEGHDIAIGRRRCFLTTRHEPLHHLGSRTEKTVLGEALHARVGNIGMVPRLHGKQGWRNEDFADGGRARVRNPSAGGGEVEKMRLWLGKPKTEGKNPVYRGRWSERRTIHLDQCTYRVSSPCLFRSHAHATPLVIPSKGVSDDG